MKALRIGTGIGSIVMAIIAYPFYMEYLITPILDVIDSMAPTLNIWEQAYIGVVPFVSLVLILFLGMMYLLGKAGIGGNGKEDHYDIHYPH